MASATSSRASWALVILLILTENYCQCIVGALSSSLQKQDLITNFTLQPTKNAIFASWSLLNPSGEVASFQVDWINYIGWKSFSRNCPVEYPVNKRQYHSADQCDKTPALQPCTVYSVKVQGLNKQSQSKTELTTKSQRTLPAVAIDRLSVVPTEHGIHVSWSASLLCWEVKWYRVAWVCDAGKRNHQDVRKSNNLQEGYVVPSQQKCTVYNITVQPMDDATGAVGGLLSKQVSTNHDGVVYPSAPGPTDGAVNLTASTPADITAPSSPLLAVAAWRALAAILATAVIAVAVVFCWGRVQGGKRTEPSPSTRRPRRIVNSS